MKRNLLLFIFSCITIFSYADRIYVMNSPGYNTAEPQLLAAIASNGHTITENNTTFVLPPGFTSRCVDPVNGYDWLCFFGDNDFTGMIPQIQAFIDAGGKVFYQYEVTCCTQSSSSVAAIAAATTGLPIFPNANGYIAFNGGADGWTADSISCCVSFIGAAYKGLDGLPVANQLQATTTLPGAAPPIGTCLNFGFFFTTTDFIGAANQGGMVGIGDVNLWYDGDEPFSNGGITPINQAAIDYFFPGPATTCYLFPPGCLQTFNNQSNLNINLGNDTTLCPGQTLNLNATTSGATYLWQDNSTNPTFTVTTPGTYWVQVTSSCGTDTDSIVVNYGPNLVVDIGNDTVICLPDTITLDATTAGATYLWQDNSTNPTFDVTAAGTYWVQIDIGGCTGTDSIDIINGALVNVDLGNDTTLCQGIIYQLDATTPGVTYLWQDNSTNPTFNVSTAGTYWVQITSICGTDTDSIDITYNPAPVIDLGNDTSICQGNVINLDATTAGATYLWQDNSTNPTFNVSMPGTYWVEVDLAGCDARDSIDITYINLPVAQLGPDTVLCEGESILLNANNPGSTYLWQDNSTASTFNVNALGTYWVNITNSCGSDIDSIDISYQNCDCVIYVPNSFTPNDDEINPKFFPATSCHLSSYLLIIFDRWGREIFTASDISTQWDGTINGTPIPIGVYAYHLSYEFNIPGALPQTRIGHVNLLR